MICWPICPQIGLRQHTMKQSKTRLNLPDGVGWQEVVIIMGVGAMPQVLYLLFGFEAGVVTGLGLLAAINTGLNL